MGRGSKESLIFHGPTKGGRGNQGAPFSNYRGNTHNTQDNPAWHNNSDLWRLENIRPRVPENAQPFEVNQVVRENGRVRNKNPIDLLNECFGRFVIALFISYYMRFDFVEPINDFK